MKGVFQFLQSIGKALMFPIAVLPIAALLLRFGQDDIAAIFGMVPKDGITPLTAIAQAGSAIFGNLGIIFCIGVAIGFSRKYKEAAALAGLVGFFAMGGILVTYKVFKDLATVQGQFIIGGIVVGMIAGFIADFAVSIQLPKFLGFFSGRRLVPILTGLVCVILGYILVIVWPPCQRAIDALGHTLVNSGNVGLFFYGIINRLLLVTGLHHIINTLVWFQFGSFTDAAGKVITGDLNRYFAHDPTAGIFMAGFYPIMMFGLVGVALAIVLNAKKEKRPEVAGNMASVAFTAFLTGITEPLEYSFMFIAPVLFLIHAVLTGLSMAVVNMLAIKHGFGFSAGLIDFVLNFKFSTNGILLIPVGLVFFAIYFVIFYFAIKFFNLKTPGREDEEETKEEETSTSTSETTTKTSPQAPSPSSGKAKTGSKERALQFLEALGGFENLTNIDACVTRLRLDVVSTEKIDRARLKVLADGKDVATPTTKAVQVILGSEAEQISDILNNMRGK